MNEPQTPSRKIELLIEFYPETGRASVSGPINDRIMCFGLLEEAKIIILRHHERKAAQQNPIGIEIVSGPAADALLKQNGK